MQQEVELQQNFRGGMKLEKIMQIVETVKVNGAKRALPQSVPSHPTLLGYMTYMVTNGSGWRIAGVQIT